MTCVYFEICLLKYAHILECYFFWLRFFFYVDKTACTDLLEICIAQFFFLADYSNHERYDNAMERLFDSVLAAHNLPSDFGGGRQRRSTSVDITIKDTLGICVLWFDNHCQVYRF